MRLDEDLIRERWAKQVPEIYRPTSGNRSASSAIIGPVGFFATFPDLAETPKDRKIRKREAAA
jgi:hypothetical protein